MIKRLKNFKKKKLGFTLGEILLVVGFIAVSGMGAYVIYSKVQSGSAANTEVRNIDTLRAGIKNIYSAQVGYTGLGKQVLLNAKVVPDNMVLGAGAGTDIINGFGGKVEVAPVKFGSGGADNAFTITYPEVPLDICTKLVAGAGPAFNMVVAGGETVKDTSKATANAMDMAKAAAGCASGNSAGVATIVFTSL